MQRGEVWFVEFPFEEGNGVSNSPVVVLDENV